MLNAHLDEAKVASKSWLAGLGGWLQSQLAIYNSRILGRKHPIGIKTFKNNHGSLIQSGTKLLPRCGGYGQLQRLNHIITRFYQKELLFRHVSCQERCVTHLPLLFIMRIFPHY